MGEYEPVASIKLNGMEAYRMSLLDSCEAGGNGEVDFMITSLPDGQYDLSVAVVDVGGRERGSSAGTKFKVDVSILIAKVLENDDYGDDGEEDDQVTGLEFSEEDLGIVAKCKELGLEPRRKPARIFDGFTYSNEIDLLLLRAEEYGDLLTGMILVEASKTFQGHDKAPVFASQAHRLPPHLRSIIRNLVEDFAELPDSVNATCPSCPCPTPLPATRLTQSRPGLRHRVLLQPCPSVPAC
jgi:hypothetical protein